MMQKPERRQLRPQFAEVMKFEGWSNVREIHDWLKGRIFFVPRGYEHALRRENEFDRSNHHILEDAAPFLVLDSTDQGKVRVDVGEWIVLGGSHGDDLGKMTQKDLDRFYSSAVEP